MAKYIDREDLIEWLKRIPLKDLSDGLGLCRVIMEDDFKKAIKKMPKGIIADVAPVRHGRWIPVTKRFPNTGAVVLTFSNKDGVNIGKYVGYGAFVVRKWDINSKPSRTTHWMPLPEPPKEEK